MLIINYSMMVRMWGTYSVNGRPNFILASTLIPFLLDQALCQRVTRYADRCVANANVCLRGSTQMFESAVWWGFISQRHFWMEIWVQTYSIFRIGLSALSESSLKATCHRPEESEAVFLLLFSGLPSFSSPSLGSPGQTSGNAWTSCGQ